MSTDMIIKANVDPEGLKRELMRYKKKDLIDFVIWMGQNIHRLKEECERKFLVHRRGQGVSTFLIFPIP